MGRPTQSIEQPPAEPAVPDRPSDNHGAAQQQNPQPSVPPESSANTSQFKQKVEIVGILVAIVVGIATALLAGYAYIDNRYAQQKDLQEQQKSLKAQENHFNAAIDKLRKEAEQGITALTIQFELKTQTDLLGLLEKRIWVLEDQLKKKENAEGRETVIRLKIERENIHRKLAVLYQRLPSKASHP